MYYLRSYENENGNKNETNNENGLRHKILMKSSILRPTTAIVDDSLEPSRHRQNRISYNFWGISDFLPTIDGVINQCL